MKKFIFFFIIVSCQGIAKEPEPLTLFKLVKKFAFKEQNINKGLQSYNSSNEIMFSALLLSSIDHDKSLSYLIRLSSYSFGEGPNPYIEDLLRDKKSKIKTILLKMSKKDLCNKDEFTCRHTSISSLLKSLNQSHIKGIDSAGDDIKYLTPKIQKSCMRHLTSRLQELLRYSTNKNHQRETSSFQKSHCTNNEQAKKIDTFIFPK